MKQLYVLLLILCMGFSISSCKKKDDMRDLSSVLWNWERAIREYNYTAYKASEAYPKSYPVFKEMYRDYYFEDIMLVDAEECDKEQLRKDPEGNEYYYRSADFECVEVNRKTEKHQQIVRGNVVFIKFLDGKRKRDGWLMSNRTLIRVKR